LALRLIQIVCIVLLIGFLISTKFGFQELAEWGGPQYRNGFLTGIAFCVGLYGLICWIDPSSRPRGRSGQK
jgi:hypothetical protein